MIVTEKEVARPTITITTAVSLTGSRPLVFLRFGLCAFAQRPTENNIRYPSKGDPDSSEYTLRDVEEFLLVMRLSTRMCKIQLDSHSRSEFFI